MKKKSSKRSASRSRTGAVKKAVKKAGKKMMAKAGLSKGAVKKKVVKKLKRVGVAMARAAMDELMPPNEQGVPGRAVTPAKTRSRSKNSASPRPPR